MLAITIDTLDNDYLLKGDVISLWSNRRIRFFLKDYLKAEIDLKGGGTVTIPFEKQNQEAILDEIYKLLEKFEIESTASDTVKHNLRDYHQAKENFKAFSQKALEIRDDNCSKDEFREFTTILSQNFIRQLYPLQLLSSYHAAFAQNACNFSVPGSGKTSIAYAAYAYLRAVSIPSKNVNKILVVGPLSSFGPWENEYKECFGHEVSSQRIAELSPEARTKYFYSGKTAELTLLSYNGAAASCDDISFFLRNNNVLMVLDEAHRIKNTEGGIWSQAILKLAPYAKARFILTGTPAPNGYIDLYNLFEFIWPGSNPIGYPLYQLKDIGKTSNDYRVDDLIKNISPFFIRIKKSDLPDMPPIVEHPIQVVGMKVIQKEIYDYIENSSLKIFKSEQNKSSKNILVNARLIRLMQAATNPGLLLKPINNYFGDDEDEIGDGATTDSISESIIEDIDIINKVRHYHENETPAKFDVVVSLVKAILERGEKVIIWTTFVQNIFDLRFLLEKHGFLSEILYGGIPVQSSLPGEISRESIIEEFHNPLSVFKIIVANPFAVGESISLHKACNNAIYLERTFNAANFLQSKDRIHRFGGAKDKAVNYYYILSEKSVDFTIHKRLEEKVARMLELIEKMPIPLFDNNADFETDSEDDIKAIIRDYVNRSSKA